MQCPCDDCETYKQFLGIFGTDFNEKFCPNQCHEYSLWRREQKEQTRKIEKVRPVAKPEEHTGEDGRDSRWEIGYYCPTCGRSIRGWARDNACDQCGTFYDWSGKQPRIQVVRKVVWE